MFPLGVLSAMAPKMAFVMKSPKSVMKGAAKAKAKGKAKATAPKKSDPEKKVKKEPAKTPEKKAPEESTDVEVSRLDDDPKAESLRALYRGWQGMIPRRKSLLASGS